MEFHEKLQALRKQKGLTQEELATALYVSRAAVSKWESNRGYPSIDSLKAMAAFFSVTVDELLSGEEILTIAKENSKKQQERHADILFGMLDCSTALFFFLPLFAQRTAGTVQAVSLLALRGVAPYLKTAYTAAAAGMILVGVLTLALQGGSFPTWVRIKRRLSSLCNVAGVLLFIVSPQPYAAAVLFLFLIMKMIILMKRP